MTTGSDLPVEERIVRLLAHLGIERAHFAGRTVGDWRGMVAAHPEAIASLTLLCPDSADAAAFQTLGHRLLVVSGDRGVGVDGLRQLVSSLPEAGLVTLQDYPAEPWTDVVADRTEEIGTAALDFLARIDESDGLASVPLAQDEGAVDGVTYRVLGSGPPLVLLPLALAPSQWDPLLPKLSERYCTITLGGAELGFVAVLEARGHLAGYLRMVASLMDEVQLEPGQTVLDVGCGSGVLDRWLAHRTSGANPITAVDVSPYLLREAKDLAVKEGLDQGIEFRQGNAEELPLPDDSFDAAMSVTVMEEVDADRMLAEMVRVTRPGGRVAVIVRAVDMPWRLNMPLRAEVKAKLETPSGNVEPNGCADASLYQRFHEVGLVDVKSFPQLAAFDKTRGPSTRFLDNRIVRDLTREEADEARQAVAEAEAAGTFFFAWPHHCAVGTKPG